MISESYYIPLIMEQRLLDPPTQDRNNYSSVTNDFSLDEEKKFFVANIAFTVTPEQVQQWFSSQFGPVQFVKIIYDKKGRSKGFGFVYMESEEGAKAVEEFSKKSGYRVEMYGRKIQLHKHTNDRSNLLDTRVPPTVHVTKQSRDYRHSNKSSTTDVKEHVRASPSNTMDVAESSSRKIPYYHHSYVETWDTSFSYPHYAMQSLGPFNMSPQAEVSSMEHYYDSSSSYSGDLHAVDSDPSLHSMQYYSPPPPHPSTGLAPMPYYMPVQGSVNMYPMYVHPMASNPYHVDEISYIPNGVPEKTGTLSQGSSIQEEDPGSEQKPPKNIKTEGEITKG